jgi:lactosylceramide 4-alpha-galactosyltransferase
VSNRSLDALGANYVGLESPDVVGSSVLNFAWDSVGHTVAGSCVEELRANFRGDIWGHNGPELITRVLLKMCNSSRVSNCAVEAARSFETSVKPQDVITQKTTLCSAVPGNPKLT